MVLRVVPSTKTVSTLPNTEGRMGCRDISLWMRRHTASLITIGGIASLAIGANQFFAPEQAMGIHVALITGFYLNKHLQTLASKSPDALITRLKKGSKILDFLQNSSQDPSIDTR